MGNESGSAVSGSTIENLFSGLPLCPTPIGENITVEANSGLGNTLIVRAFTDVPVISVKDDLSGSTLSLDVGGQSRFLTDHLAWYSEASVKHLQTAVVEEVVRVLVNNAPTSAANT